MVVAPPATLDRTVIPATGRQVSLLTVETFGRPLEIIATVTNPTAVKAILECLGLPARPPPLAPAREPEQPEFQFEG